MGYIFDALNKSGNADQPRENSQENTPSPTPEETTSRSTLRLDEILARHAEQAKAVDQPEPEVEVDLADAAMAKMPTLSQPSWEPESPDQVFAEGDEEWPSVSESLASLPSVVADASEQAIDIEGEAKADEEVSEPSPFRLPGAPFSPHKTRAWYQFWKRSPFSAIDDRLVVLTSAASAMAEEYRSIRTSILARHQNERHLVHTITSATPQEGKTITCLNLGLAFAELRNRKTIIVECDLRLPTFEKLLQLEHKSGLIPYLNGEVSLNDAITQIPGTGAGLDIMTAGGRVSDEAVQMISSNRMTKLIQTLRAKYDHVIIDTPPVVDLADAGILGAQGDEVLLVARMRRTPQELVEQAIRTLHSYNADVAGVIATDNPRNRGRGYGYGYRYGYGYSYAGKRGGRSRGRNRMLCAA